MIASTGVASTMIRLVAYIDQTNSGSRNQVMPGRAHRVDRDDEVQPGEDRREPGDEDADRRRRSRSVFENMRAERRVERPAGVDAAGEHRDQREQRRRSMKRYQLSRLSRGNARSRAPIISGTRKLPSTAGIDGIRKKKTMIDAVHA